MKLFTYGAAGTVTGSMHLLEHNGKKLLLECGTFQGARDESYQVNLNFPFDPSEIDAMMLSHAHIDHSGNIPNLVKRVTRARFTLPTRLLTWRISCCGIPVTFRRATLTMSTKNAAKKGCLNESRSTHKKTPSRPCLNSVPCGTRRKSK